MRARHNPAARLMLRLVVLASALALVNVDAATATDALGCPDGSQPWFAASLPGGPEADTNADGIVCEIQASPGTVFVDNVATAVPAGTCPPKAYFEIHPGFIQDRNGDGFLCFILTGAAHSKLGKEIYVDNQGRRAAPDR